MFKLWLRKFSGIFVLRNKKLFFKFFSSFVLMGIIPIFILGFLTYFKVLGILTDHVISSNISFIEQGKSNVDAYIRQIQNLQAQLSTNPKINKFFTSKTSDRAEMALCIRDIIDELSKYGASSNEITNTLGIYFAENDVVVTTNGFFEGDSFFRKFRVYQDMTYSECFDRLKNPSSRQYWKAGVVTDNFDMQKRMITSVQSLPFYTKNSASLIILMDERKLWEMFGENNADNWNSFKCIIDENGELIASSEGPKVPEILNYLDETLLSANSGDFKLEDGNTAYIATYASSPQNGWKYVSIIPESNILIKVSPVRSLYLGTITLAFLLALLLSWYLSKRSYKPVREILQVIESANVDQSVLRKNNEYKIILKTISEMFRVTKEMESKLASHIEITRMHFLLRLLKNMTNAENIKESLDLYSIHLPYPYFFVAVMKLQSYNKDSGKDMELINNFSRFTASCMAEKALVAKFLAYSVEVEENRIALLVNTDTNWELKDRAPLENAFKEMIELLAEKLNVHTVIGIGKTYPYLDMSCNSFSEAITALDYISIRGNYQIMHFDQVRAVKNSIFYPVAKEQQLMNLVKLGDYAAVAALLDDIHRVNFIEREIPVKHAQCLLMNIASSLLKILEELKLDNSEVFHEDPFQVPEIKNASSVNEFFDHMKISLKNLCFQIIEKKNSHNTELRDSILRYIQTAYTDRNLSLMGTADHFHITTPYLSKFFKEQTGYNFNDYLNRYRIQQAKYFLQQSSLSVAEISEKIGYNSAGTFIRIFKRYESITPGQYKEALPGHKY